MLEILQKYSVGKKIQIGNIKAQVSAQTMFNGIYAIYADISEQEMEIGACFCKKIGDNVALIFRNKAKLLKMGLNAEERKAIYCHELGHCFSEKQKNSSHQTRIIEDEIDSDTFAVEKCNISPEILESSLRKTYEYEMLNIKNKKGITIDRINRFVEEMTARKKNIKRLIEREKNKDNSRESNNKQYE